MVLPMTINHRLHAAGYAVLLLLQSLGAAQAVAASPSLFAQANPPRVRSFLSWYIRCNGYLGILPLLAGAGVFIDLLIVVARARRREEIASRRMVLLLPLLVGVVCAVSAGISSLSIFNLRGVQVHAIDVVAAVWCAAFTPIANTVLATVPSILVFTIGQSVRFFGRAGGNRQDEIAPPKSE